MSPLRLALTLAAIGAADADWTMKKLEFSAVSIGVAMKDKLTGWSSFTNGAQAIQITKTTNGGANWTQVKNQTHALMVMGMDVSTDPALDVVTTGMAATSYSADGDTFKGSKFGPFVSQSIKAESGGRVAVASDNGACISANSGSTFKCHKVPFQYGPAGRYVSAPSESVIYVTAGSWPSNAKKSSDSVHITANLRLVNRSFDGVAGAATAPRMALEMGPFTADPPRAGADPSGYTAELWKSSDGGENWESLLADAGNFYFNDIDCFDETHCVAVAEGFGHDGSASPGARVYVTTDGKNFTLAHHDVTDGTSLMAVKMLSATQHVVGGRLNPGLALHTSDGGSTYETKGTKIPGQMITSMSFPAGGDFALATSISALQISSLLEYAA